MRYLIPVVLAAAVAACGEGPTHPDRVDPSFARTTGGGGGLTVEIVDHPSALVEGETMVLDVDVTNPAGRPVPADVTWVSSAPAVASVSDEGALQALAQGTAEITASVGRFADAFTLTVNPERNLKPVGLMDGKNRPVGIEDTPLVFEIEVEDGNDPIESLTVFITEAPLFGEMYQVHEDGTIDYDNQIFGTGDTATPVTNSGRLVGYVPPRDASGDGSDIGSSFVYFVRDPHGSTATARLSFIDITPVNDAPVASPTVHDLVSHFTRGGLTLDFSDVDRDDRLTGVVTRFPENGTIYRSFDRPENEITEADPTFNATGLAYTYELNSVGEPWDSFEYYVTDGELSTEVVEVTINILDTNDPPNPVCPAGTERDDTGHPLTFDADGARLRACSPTEVFAVQDEPFFIYLGATDDADDFGRSIRFRLTSIPGNGVLRNSANTVITQDDLPHVLPPSSTSFGWRMSFFPDEGFHTEGRDPLGLTFEVYDVRFDDALNQEIILDFWPDELGVDIHIREP